jgi:hypothetical protein
MKSPVALAVIFLATNFLLQGADTPSASATNAPPVVQVDVSKLLNARVVTTLTDGKVVPMDSNVDGVGGVITQAAATALNNTNPHTMPDDGKFAANADHPEVVLNYSNANGKDNQVRRSQTEDEYSFDVPPGNYAKMFLFFTSGASGPATLQFVLTYQDGSTENRTMVVPDWCPGSRPGSKDCFNLIANLAKWGKNNTVLEKSNHNIFGLDLHPAPGKVLTQIKVHKTRPLVVFWGATGQLAK